MSEPINQIRDGATTIELRAAIEAVKAFGQFTKGLTDAEFVHAARFAAANFEELAKQYEKEAAV